MPKHGGCQALLEIADETCRKSKALQELDRGKCQLLDRSVFRRQVSGGPMWLEEMVMERCRWALQRDACLSGHRSPEGPFPSNAMGFPRAANSAGRHTLIGVGVRRGLLKTTRLATQERSAGRQTISSCQVLRQLTQPPMPWQDVVCNNPRQAIRHKPRRVWGFSLDNWPRRAGMLGHCPPRPSRGPPPSLPLLLSAKSNDEGSRLQNA